MAIYSALLVWLGFMFIFLVLLMIAGYVMNCLLLMKIFDVFKPCDPIMAWIPFVNSYYLGVCCNGKDGQNVGLFGQSIPNEVYNFGWLAGTAILVVTGWLSNPFLSSISGLASFVVSVLYSACIWSFMYSRLEGRTEEEVRGIAILSGIVGLVAFVKILTSSGLKVYSQPNDIYPTGRSGSVGGGYGGQCGSFDGKFSDFGYDTTGSFK